MVKRIKSKEQAEKMLEDEFADGALLKIEKQFTPTGPMYTYGAVKMRGVWYVTGDPHGMSTADFIAWMCRGREAPAPRLYWAKVVYEI